MCKNQELSWHFEVIIKLQQQENMQIVLYSMNNQYSLIEQSVTKALLLRYVSHIKGKVL